MSEWTKIVKLNDLHVPFEDRKSVHGAIEFVVRIQPQIVVIDEWMDFYELSRFLKDPTSATGYTLHEARKRCQSYYGELRKAVPRATIVEVEANHGKRIEKYLQRNAPALCGLPEFSYPEFMGIDRFNIEYRKHFVFRRFLFKHGTTVRRYSGYTARGELDREGMSGASGHSHRLGQHYRTLRGGAYTWIECGMLCRKDMDYLEGAVADWQTGIGFVQFKDNTNHYAAAAIPVVDGEVLWS